MKSTTGIFLILVSVTLYISHAEAGVICFSGSGLIGCIAGCDSKPGFNGGICRTGHLGYQYCSCYSQADGSLVPICTGDGGYEACQEGCQVAGGFEAVCETQINFCNCLPKSKSGTATFLGNMDT